MLFATRPVPAWPWPPLLRASAVWHAGALGAALWVPGAAPWALVAVLLNHALITGSVLLPRSGLLGPNVTRLPAPAVARGEVALTIDDGPDPAVTPQVLKLLADSGQRATFFCIAERALAQPALVHAIVAAGHSVQNHTARHALNFSLLGPAATTNELARAQQAIAAVTGQPPRFFRAPAGFRNPFLAPVLHRMGLVLVSWTRRGFDTRERDPQRVLARLTRELAAGDILLLHDGNAARTTAGEPVILAVLPALLARLQAAGLRSVTLTRGLTA